MKQLNTIILIFIAYWGQAQQYSYAALDSLIEFNLRDYNYEAAGYYAEQLEFKALEEYGPKSLQYQKTLEQLIKTYQVLERPSEAMLIAGEALDIQYELSGERDLAYYQYLEQLIERYFKNCAPSKDALINDLLATHQLLYPKQKDAKYWSIVSQLADWYYCNAEYEQALIWYQKLQNYKPIYDYQLGITYERLHNYSKALEFLEPLLQKNEKDELKERLITIYKQVGNVAKAKALQEDLDRSYQQFSMSYDVLDSLMRASRQAFDYDLALSYAEFKEQKTLVDYHKNHPVYQQALLDLAYMYGFVKRYEQATLACKEVLEIQLEISNKQKDEAYLNKLKQILGKIYQGERTPDKDSFLIEAMTVYEGLYQTTTTSAYMDWQDKLGKWYFKQGKYPQAVEVYEDLVEIDPRYATGLSRAYLRLGRYKEAEMTLSRMEDKPGKDLVLIKVYEATQQHEKLLRLCQKLIKKQPFQKRRWLTIMGASYTALGYTSYAQESYEKALKLYQTSTAFEQTLDNNATMTMMGDDIYKIGMLYSNLRQYEEAEQWFNKVLEIYPSTYPEHRDALRQLFLQYWKQGNEQWADSLLMEINKNTIYLLEEYYPKLSEERRLDFYATVEEDIELCYSYASQKPVLDSSLAVAVQDLSLITKNLSLQNTERFLNIVINQKDPKLLELYYEWVALRRRIVEAMTVSKESLFMQKIDLEKLLLLADKKEVELAAQSAVFAAAMNSQKEVVTTAGLKNKLIENEVAIDFLTFRAYQNGQWGKTSMYYALVLQKDWVQPQLIALSTASKLNIFLEKEVSPMGLNYISDASFNGALYMLLWMKLLPHLKDIKTIHLCPTGLLNKLAFSALQNPLNNKRLLEEYELHYYGNLRDFVLEKKKGSTKKITLFGGINFYGQKATEWARFNAQKRDFTQGYAFNLLSGTYQETEVISQLFRQANWSTDWFTGNQASEEQLRKLTTKDAGSSILHIATHGFFFAQASKRDKNLSTVVQNLYQAKNPLFRSGIALAGINRIWVDEELIASSKDGLLTAYEVAGLDLHQTELVVLSACETGRGDIDKNEGVMGLQRAFKLAGAEQLIISLWKVPDEQTATLMELFYAYYLNDKLPIAQAFRQAQLDLQKRYANPYYWAAFVLME